VRLLLLGFQFFHTPIKRLKLVFQPFGLVFQPGQFLLWRQRRSTGACPVVLAGGVVPMPPAPATAAVPAPKAKPPSGICKARGIIASAIAAPSACYRSKTLWARSISSWHIPHLLSI
jgi:hypothetical protein